MDKNNPESISRMVLMAPKKQIEETKDLQTEIWAGDKPVYNSKIEDVFQKLESGELGLTSEEAKVKLEKFGRNALDEGKKMTLIQRFFEQLKDMMIIVLLVAALVSGIMAVINGHYADLIDSGLILLIVIMNAVIGLVQESNAEKALDALKDMNKPDAKVIRDGIQMSIKSEEIAIGDVVVLEAGDIVPADMRLIESVSLKIEEAALTGESVPSEKHVGELENENPPLGDRTNLCYSSGIVSYGRGKGVVFATGMSTEVGKIAKMLSSGGDDKTPLQ
ncbi:MAG: HAD-IC family P-type ATPase, partial [Clostridia bacterium]